MPHLGPVPINWYGLGFAAAFLLGWWLVWRWSHDCAHLRAHLDRLLLWIAIGTVLGARLYYVVQNGPLSYLHHPWQIVAVWEGGLAYFGGLFGAVAAALLYSRHYHLPFLPVADRFAPAIAIGSAVGRIACGLDGMDYGTSTRMPWGVIYTHPNSYAPLDGVPRHPDQYYELLGDLLIAYVLIKMRGRFPDGALFFSYLVLFSLLRFFVFFFRGNVEAVALGLKNAQWTALAIIAAAASCMWRLLRVSRKPIAG